MESASRSAAFTPEEAYAADEAFLTSASNFVLPIVEIDGKRIGGGQPGPVARRAAGRLFIDMARSGYKLGQLAAISAGWSASWD